MIIAECSMQVSPKCKKEVKFNNIMEYNEALGKSGPEFECTECQKFGGPEND